MAKRLSPARYGRLCVNPFYRAFARGLTFTWFALTLLWFWATWQDIGALAARLGPGGTRMAAAGSVIGASAVLAIPDLFGSRTVQFP